MFSQTSVCVRFIGLILVVLSVVSWAIIFKKQWVLRKYLKEIRDLEIVLYSSETSVNIKDILEYSDGVVAHILRHSVKNSRVLLSKRESFFTFVNTELSRYLGKLSEHIDILTTINSSSILIGLLGMIWEVMQNLKAAPLNVDTLDVTLLSMHDALFVMLLGLIVAIPANIFYNRFSAVISEVSSRLNSLVRELGTFVIDSE